MVIGTELVESVCANQCIRKIISNKLDLSILITNYNYQDYIKKSIESCIKQMTSFNYEIVVIDDGSTDNSLNLIKSFKEKTRFYSIKNSGIEKASNYWNK